MSVLRAPYDINFYQAQRAVEFARPVLKDPSVHITVSACADGTGNDSFIKVFQAASRLPNVPLARCFRLLSPPLPPPLLGWHKSARLAQIMHTADLCTVMGVDDEVVKSVFMRPLQGPPRTRSIRPSPSSARTLASTSSPTPASVVPVPQLARRPQSAERHGWTIHRFRTDLEFARDH